MLLQFCRRLCTLVHVHEALPKKYLWEASPDADFALHINNLCNGQPKSRSETAPTDFLGKAPYVEMTVRA
jgi:hypothetical protein